MMLEVDVNLEGLQAYLGEEAYALWLGERMYPKTELQCQLNRILAAIIPRQPRTEADCAAISQAAYAQTRFDWENPEGLEKMRIGSFSVERRPLPEICKEARAILLRAGLLYRGVEC